ncbi:MAG: nitronate monooxygenase [Actinomycetota bacterium]|nr:nitronate monooxygenase [Actinomycetota bacterium]
MSNSHPRLHTRICDLFGIAYPIVQTGMGWVSTAKLTAATSAAGGIGFLATATQTFDEMKESVAQIREKTDKPFGINVRTDAPDIEDRLDLSIKSGIKVVSFAQAPKPDMVKKLKDSGVVTIPTIAARRHAEKVAEWGVDAVIAQGSEGGGHTGEVPTAVLVPQVTSAVDIPVLAAGGITDGKGLVASLAWGAEGIAMGTRFLLSAESGVPQSVKQAYFDSAVTDTVRTRAIDGVPQRVINTTMVQGLESAKILRFPRAMLNAIKFRRLTETSFSDLLREGLSMRKNQNLTWSQIALAANAPMLTKATMVEGNHQIGIMPTGVGLGVIESAPPVELIIQSIVTEASEILSELNQPNVN